MNETVYRVLWDYLQRFSDERMKMICEKMVYSFKPTSQTPFPLVANFMDVEKEIEETERLYVNRVPEYKMLPEPEGGRMSEKELKEFMDNVMTKVLKGKSMPTVKKAR